MKQLNTLLQHPTMQTLVSQTHHADALAQTWQRTVPEALAKLSVPTQLKEHKLIVMCKSNAIAAKVKLLSPSLVIALQKQGLDLNAIQAKVQVKSSPEAKPKTARQLSDQALVSLNALEKKLHNTALGDAILKIMRNAKR